MILESTKGMGIQIITYYLHSISCCAEYLHKHTNGTQKRLNGMVQKIVGINMGS